MMLDYRAVMIEDANAARSDEAHVAALTTFALVFGDLLSTDEAIEILKRPSVFTNGETPSSTI
jgi:isochorismate hydrolase